MSNQERFQEIVTLLRGLPEALSFDPGAQFDVAGKLICEAIDLGRLAGPEYLRLRAIRECERPNGDMNRVWLNAVEILLPNVTPGDLGKRETFARMANAFERMALSAPPPAAGEDGVLDPEDIAILKELAKTGTTMTQYDLEAMEKLGLSRKTIGTRLKGLRLAGFVTRSHHHRGDAITTLGRAKITP